MSIERKVIENIHNGLPQNTRRRIKKTVKAIVKAKERGIEG